MKKYTFLLSSVLILLYSCNENKVTQNSNEGIDTSETVKAPKGAKEGYSLPGLEHGLLQSPINIISKETVNNEHNVFMYFNDEINKIENLGHTVQLNFEPGSTITKDGNTYGFKQIHFHTPSEHLIDGITYPMEMHIVNTIVDSTNEKSTQYLVLSMIFKMGKKNKFIDEFIDFIPKTKHQEAEIKVSTIRLSDLMSDVPEEDLNKCYHYKGSLTTPPYTESVNWFVSKHIYEASKEQIQKINKIEGNNARHVQALYGRTVKEE